MVALQEAFLDNEEEYYDEDEEWDGDWEDDEEVFMNVSIKRHWAGITGRAEDVADFQQDLKKAAEDILATTEDPT